MEYYNKSIQLITTRHVIFIKMKNPDIDSMYLLITRKQQQQYMTMYDYLFHKLSDVDHITYSSIV